ncbi:MAG: acyltransferase [Oscillospiraceae bacterium]|nr:acyltransferase [Oscillospiraceae bacterium]
MSNRNNNCFNFIRLVAAVQVFLGHALRHLQVDVPVSIRPLVFLIRGVPVFFILSGFLIWNSLNRSDDFKQFVQKRALRLYPELWAGVLLNAVIMLLLYGSEVQWLPFLAFQFTQATFLQFWTPDSLQGYGYGAPNGALWTIGVMLQCYLVLWAIHFVIKKWGKQEAGSKKRCVLLMVLLLAAIVDSLLSIYVKGILPEVLGKLFAQTFVPYIWLFLIGAVLAESFDRIIAVAKRLWFVFLGLVLVIGWTGIDIGYSYGIVSSLFLGLAMIGFAYRFPKLTIRHDISYGLYIYHMVVVNAMIELGFTGKLIYVAIALAVSVLIAILSYVTIGRLSKFKTKR